MIGRRSVIGLTLLSALLFTVFATQSAVAATAVNTTGFTCIKGEGAKDFADAHCDKNVGAGKGEYGHVLVPLGKEMEVEVGNEGVTEETKSTEPAVLKSSIGLTKTEISCASAKGKGSGLQKDTEGKHGGTGSGSTKFSGCKVVTPLKCTVKEPIEVSVAGGPVEALGPEANEMAGEVKGAGEKETFTQITYEGPECALKGLGFSVTGSAFVTSGPTTESSQTNKWTGATAVYTPKNGMEKLKLGSNTAEVSVITTVRAVGGAPLSGTTVT